MSDTGTQHLVIAINRGIMDYIKVVGGEQLDQVKGEALAEYHKWDEDDVYVAGLSPRDSEFLEFDRVGPEVESE